MSVNRPSRSADDDLSASNFHSEQDPSFGQDSIDQRLKRLREDVLPFYPFLLTVPTDVPFRLGNRFVNNWAVGDDGPFTPEEQQLQYMTFLTHHEGDSLLVAVGDWSDGTGNVMSDQRSGPQSAASTPSSGSLKKKISLSDYKNKRKGGASASPLSQEAIGQGSSTIHTFDDNQQHISKASPAKETSSKPGGNPTSIQGSESNGRKRPSRIDTGQSSLQDRDHSDLASPKRPRLSPASAVRPDRRERSKPHKLPALLSPTLPPTSSSPRLPRLLSPTLPPDIEKELAKLPEGLTITESSQTKNTPRTDPARPRIHKPNTLDRNTSQSDSASVISRQNLYNKASNPTHHKPSSISIDATNSDSCETVKADAVSQKEANTSQYGTLMKSRLIVKLRYGRANKKRIEALLKFSGKRKHLSRSPVKESVDTEIPHGTRAERGTPKNLVSDRSHSRNAHADGRSKDTIGANATVPLRERSKEQKSSILEKPETPGSSTQTLSHQSEKARQSSAAPSKDHRDISHRSESVATEPPLQANSKQAISDPVATNRQSPLPSSSQASARNGERRAWKDEYQKYGALGRELKHTAERHTAKGNMTGSEEKLAAATAIEAILCFILAFVADDKSKALSRQTGDSTSWLSILAYWRVVKKTSAPYPRLYSLCLILGALSYEAIHALDLERLAAIPIPGEPTSVPTPDNDGSSAASGEKRSRKESLELKSRLPECYKESQRLWLEGCRGLTEDVLAREFPNTWTGRSKNYSEQGRQQSKAGDYSGEYFLPIGKTSTPVETVRFGDAMLKEWCINEGVEWQGRLNLS